MVMFDSLNRRMLPAYGSDFIYAPNFKRLQERTVVFDNCYVGSMPCMPARRELHTGRYNFLHRSWGPLEPFDDSMPEILKKNQIYTHLVSDHQHYWEDGGCTYHTRYSSWEISRGQEGDPWKGEVKDPETPEHIGRGWRQDWINRKHMQDINNHPQICTFRNGMEFIETNCNEDGWFLQIETFDPHEPFFSFDKYKDYYKHDYNGPHFDWPEYEKVTESAEEVRHVRNEYSALLSMCDEQLGKVLDLMDKYDLWKDTMLIVNTDHGYLLGEHDWWAKCVMPFYNEIAHIPMYIWDPTCGRKNIHCSSLVQTIDIAPTLLDYFGIAIPADMQGKSLRNTILNDEPVRKAALFGTHGGHVNCTDGRYVYMRAPVNDKNKPLCNYTLMPTHMRNMFSVDELQNLELAQPFSFTKGCKTLKIESNDLPLKYKHDFVTMLFDLESDPGQLHPIENTLIEEKMKGYIVELMKDNDAPIDQFVRLDL